MQTNDQAEILESWKTFVARGIILGDKVRPIIARSWERCRDLGLDPWSYTYPKCSDSLLNKKRAKYAELVSLSSPVLNYAFTLLNSNVCICDSDGFVFDLVTPLKNYPRTLGTYINESTCGNGAITITLNEKVPIRMDGYEHYRIVAQTYSNVSAPIILANNTLVGVLNGVSPFGTLPNKSLPMIISAAKLIEHLLIEAQPNSITLENLVFFREMIDCCSQFVVTLDSDGTVLVANQAFESLLDTGNKLVGRSLDHYLVGKNDLSLLLENEFQQPENQVIKFKGLAVNQANTTLDCQLVRKNQIRLYNGDIHTMLVFSHSSIKDTFEDHLKHPIPLVNLNKSQSQVVDYIGKSPSWNKINAMIQKTAQFPSNVLLNGETGTGKEVVARAIHRQSNRKGHFVAINCGSIPKDLLHSELFGYEEGAFTGARAQGSMGKFEYAHEGTLLLDEIGEMPQDMQVTLLRFLQERTITRINSNKSKKVDVRIIAATNSDMAELVRTGQFRQDLYYRLNVIEITLPPLRERQSDIALLSDYYISELSKQFNIQPKVVSEDVLDILCQYDWPGNVRELKNVIEKALVLSEGMVILPEVLPINILHCAHVPLELKESCSDNLVLERENIVRLLEQYDGNILQTAKALHIARNTLYRKIEMFNIKIKVSASEKKN